MTMRRLPETMYFQCFIIVVCVLQYAHGDFNDYVRTSQRMLHLNVERSRLDESKLRAAADSIRFQGSLPTQYIGSTILLQSKLVQSKQSKSSSDDILGRDSQDTDVGSNADAAPDSYGKSSY